MRGEDLRRVRKQTGLTQSQLGELVGFTAAYVGELERNEKKIDVRLAIRLNTALRTRIDVSYSDGLGGWTVSVTAPIPAGSGPPGRRHLVVGRYDNLADAKTVAEGLKATREHGGQICVHPRASGLLTTNQNGF